MKPVQKNPYFLKTGQRWIQSAILLDMHLMERLFPGRRALGHAAVARHDFVVGLKDTSQKMCQSWREVAARARGMPGLRNK